MMVSKERTIAVIDDDTQFRTALVESLLSLGYGAREFASAEEFFAVHGEFSCDCVITDVQMPGMCGFDLKQALTARHCPVPVIMITALAEPELNARAAASGAVCLLRKPFAATTLLSCLSSAFDC
jgi:FixJ family two-component response regulator